MTAKSYRNDHIEVSFDGDICVHAQFCVPAVTRCVRRCSAGHG